MEASHALGYAPQTRSLAQEVPPGTLCAAAKPVYKNIITTARGVNTNVVL